MAYSQRKRSREKLFADVILFYTQPGTSNCLYDHLKTLVDWGSVSDSTYMRNTDENKTKEKCAVGPGGDDCALG